MKIEYKTQHIPAPYAFEIETTLEKSDGLQVDFNLIYTGRDELDEEEILDEGFSGDDNFHWKGQLPQAWAESLDELIRKTTWTKKQDKHAHCQVFFADETGKNQRPADLESWEYWLQELQQACVESGGFEKTLEVDFVKGTKKLSLKGSFKTRMASIADYSGKIGNTSEKPIPWKMIKKVLKHVYIAEYYPEDALKSHDASGDVFLHLGGGQWYNLNKANLHLDKKEAWLSQLENIFEDLLTGPSA